MMKSAENINTINAQGDKIYVLLPDEWENVKKTERYLGIKIAVPSMIRGLLESASTFGLVLGFIKYTYGDKLSPMLFLLMDGEYYRVSVQTSLCNTCAWEGYAIAPSPEYFKFSVDESREKLKESLALCSKACPSCGSTIPKQPAFFFADDNGRIIKIKEK